MPVGSAALAALVALPAGAGAFVAPPAGAAAAARVQEGADSPPTVERALASLQSGQFAAAAAILDTVVAREPENGRAWGLLGFARRRAGDPEAALRAYERALELQPDAPGVLYNVGLAHAQRGDLEAAFEWLERSKATGRFDMTAIGLDPAASRLEDDPRYAALLPTAGELADPFAERVEAIHEWRGESQGDQFGWIARVIGDVDGDGVADAVTSAPTLALGEAENAGRIYVYSGRAGDLLWTADGAPGERLGLGLEAAGDVSGDGVPDVIAGAPGGDRAYIYSGADGAVVRVLEAPEPGGSFGRRVSDLGDVDGDGHDDVIVGAPGADAAGEDAGGAYVFSGADGSTLLELSGEAPGAGFGSSAAGYRDADRTMIVIGAPGAGPDGTGRVYVYVGGGLMKTPAYVIDADETGDRLGGMFVSVVGDVDADGHPDVYASDWSNAAKGGSTGRVFVHSGRTGERLLTLTGEAAGDGFGIGPADAGDVDGDGHDDLVVGAWQHGGGAPSGGKVYVFSGADGSPIRSFTGKVMGETLGFDATGMGDVDGDGAIDFLVTSAWSSVRGARSGRVWVLSGG